VGLLRDDRAGARTGHARVRETMSEGGTSGRKAQRGQHKRTVRGKGKCTGAEKVLIA